MLPNIKFEAFTYPDEMPTSISSESDGLFQSIRKSWNLKSHNYQNNDLKKSQHGSYNIYLHWEQK